MQPEAMTSAVLRALQGEPLEDPAFSDQRQAGIALREITDRLDIPLGDISTVLLLWQKISTSADPQMAINNLHRFVEATREPGQVRVALKRSNDVATALIALMAGSQFLSDVLISQPETFPWLVSHETLHGSRAADYYKQGALQAVAGLADRTEQRAALSRWRRREYLRIGCRDLLLLADAEDVSRDISDLAEAIIDQAAQLIFADLIQRFGMPQQEDGGAPEGEPVRASAIPYEASAAAAASDGLCVLGMGKLGGRELNFSSDIDLVFIYEAEGETRGRMEGNRRVAVISNHDFYTRVGEALIKFLGERGPDGHLFRVDMRLRPEGLDGPLVRSFDAFAYYLGTQARDWERLAYLKARVVSGPARLAAKLYRVISEFVFARMDAARIISEVQKLKVRIDREVINSDLYRREVKRGYGGIREIEFVIAAMQIIHGYNHPALRVRNTFLAVQRLLQAHVVDAVTADFYQQAYSFLRAIEHRLQMAQEAQTHTLPPPGDEFEAMARRCGFRDGEAFMRTYTQVTDAVHQRFTEFFQHDTEAVEQAARDVLLILDRTAAEADAWEALARRGIQNTDSLRLIHFLAYGTSEVFVSAEGQRFFEQMLPSLLRLTVAAPFPERVFSHLHSFALAIKSITYYYEVIAQHPDILKLLVTLFGTSDTLSAQFIAHPEFFDNLISSRTLDAADESGRQRRERLSTILSVKTPNRRLVMLRRAVHFEQIVTALKYLLRIEPLERCLRRLSDTADNALEIVMHLAGGRLLARWTGNEKPDDAAVRILVNEVSRGFALVALGKYGGLELNFFGDLDVVFIYDGAAPLPAAARDHYGSTQEFYDALADVLTAVVTEQMAGGRAYIMDARLRPYGKSAPLTTEVSAYKTYMADTAETWELQAITRARTVWGSQELLPQVGAVAKKKAGNLPVKQLMASIVEMRARLEEAADGGSDVLEVKRSRGGIVDVEFLVQYLAITSKIPWNFQGMNYFSVLADLSPAVLEPADAATLRAGYTVLRGVENTIRLVTGGGESSVALQSPNATAVAIALGFGTAENLQSSISETRAAVRSVFDRVLDLP